jgi:hypothetical protein
MSSNRVHLKTYPGLSTLNRPINLPPYSTRVPPTANISHSTPSFPDDRSLPSNGIQGDKHLDVPLLPENILPPPLLNETEAAAALEEWKKAIGMSTGVPVKDGDNIGPQIPVRKKVSIDDLLNPVNNRGVKEMMSISALLNAHEKGT